VDQHLTQPNRSPAFATILAAAIAAILLVVAVLPAEYGIDWTGLGRAFGLTAMGKRKMAESKPVNNTSAAAVAASATTPAVVPAATPVATSASAAPEQYSTISTQPLRNDEIEVKLAPKGQAEYKAVMSEGEFLTFTWDAAGASLEFDFHGDPAAGPAGAFLSFHKGSAAGSGGSLKAPFTGVHGWYWKNTTDKNVVIKLRVSGFYSEIKRM
jgi:hypothetical protein